MLVYQAAVDIITMYNNVSKIRTRLNLYILLKMPIDYKKWSQSKLSYLPSRYNPNCRDMFSIYTVTLILKPMLNELIMIFNFFSRKDYDQHKGSVSSAIETKWGKKNIPKQANHRIQYEKFVWRLEIKRVHH